LKGFGILLGMLLHFDTRCKEPNERGVCVEGTTVAKCSESSQVRLDSCLIQRNPIPVMRKHYLPEVKNIDPVLVEQRDKPCHGTSANRVQYDLGVNAINRVAAASTVKMTKENMQVNQFIQLHPVYEVRANLLVGKLLHGRLGHAKYSHDTKSVAMNKRWDANVGKEEVFPPAALNAA
jgi:hypothetical protein